MPFAFGIKLDDHKAGKIYYPGDILRGEVHLIGPFPNDYRVFISIEFRGISYTYSALKPHTDSATLCSIKGVLAEAGHYPLLSHEKLTRRFKIEVPQYARNQSKYASLKSWDSSTHLLPPTWGSSNTTSFGFIRYEIVAKVEYADSASPFFWRENITEAGIPICFRRSTPTISHPPRVVDEFVDITMPQLKTLTRSSGMQFSLSSFFRRSPANTNPREYAKLQLHAPTEITIGKPQTLFLELADEGDSGFTNPMPQIKLLSIEHRIQSRLWVRTRDTPESIHKTSVDSDIVSGLERRSTPISTRRFRANMTERVLEEGGLLDLGKEMGDLILDGRLAPGFESYAMSLRYDSKTTVRVEVGGREQKLVFKLSDITVL